MYFSRIREYWLGVRDVVWTRIKSTRIYFTLLSIQGRIQRVSGHSFYLIHKVLLVEKRRPKAFENVEGPKWVQGITLVGEDAGVKVLEKFTVLVQREPPETLNFQSISTVKTRTLCVLHVLQFELKNKHALILFVDVYSKCLLRESRQVRLKMFYYTNFVLF